MTGRSAVTSRQTMSADSNTKTFVLLQKPRSLDRRGLRDHDAGPRRQSAGTLGEEEPHGGTSSRHRRTLEDHEGDRTILTFGPCG